MSIEILYCLKRKRNICVKTIITSQNTALMWIPALRSLQLAVGILPLVSSPHYTVCFYPQSVVKILPSVPSVSSLQSTYYTDRLSAENFSTKKKSLAATGFYIYFYFILNRYNNLRFVINIEFKQEATLWAPGC